MEGYVVFSFLTIGENFSDLFIIKKNKEKGCFGVLGSLWMSAGCVDVIQPKQNQQFWKIDLWKFPQYKNVTIVYKSRFLLFKI